MNSYHYLIKKGTEQGVTRTNIHLLSEDESIQELARILGGAKITDTVLQNAAEMKALAGQTK